MKKFHGASLVTLALLCAESQALAQQTGTVPSAAPSPPPTAAVTPVQGDAPSPAAAIGEIIVTASKRSESINKVPLTITALSGGDLSDRGIRDVADLQRVVSGFVAVDTNVGAPAFFLRGVGYYNFSFLGKPAVTVYQDEAPLPYQAMAVGTDLDLERVEVLKGPQGTVFGSNSTGGAINFIAAKPTRAFSAGVSASYGRFSENVVDGFVSGPLSNNVEVRIAASHTGMGDWQESYTRDDSLGAKNISEGRFIVDAHNGPLRVEAIVSGVIDKSDTLAGQLTNTNGGEPNLVAYPLAPHNARAADWNDCISFFCLKPRNNNYQIHTSLRADYDLSHAVTLTSLTSYTYADERFAQDTDGTTLDLTNDDESGTLSSFSQELRAAGKIFGAGSWIVGANYERDTAFEDRHAASSDGVAAHAFDALRLPVLDDYEAVAGTTDKALAAFGNLDYEFLPKLTLHAGARYTDTSSDFNGCAKVTGANHSNNIGLSIVLKEPILATLPQGACYSLVPNSAGVLEPGNLQKNLDQDNFSWRSSIDYKPVKNTMLYGSISRGYKAGQFADLTAPFAAQYNPVPQEELTAYEAGFKSAVIPGLLQVNAAFFYYDYLNKQVQGKLQFPIFGFIQANVSVPKSRVEGEELEAVLRPIRGLTISGSSTFVTTRITAPFLGFTQFGVMEQLEGQSFPFTPKFQLDANIEYKWQISDGLGAFVQSNLTHRSKSYGDFVQDSRLLIPVYTTLDATGGLTRGPWRLELYGRNITNEYYWTSVFRSTQATSHIAALPVTYGAAISYKF